jgi:ABC-type lipoprotein export system ATPase subunit
VAAPGHLRLPRRAAPGADIVAEGVAKRFGERIVALDGVSFTVAPGELVLISGPSGAGKSTLLNLLAGFDRPDDGRITVAGQPLHELRDAARFRREVLGFVFQLHHLVGGLTAEENVELPLIPSERRRAARLERARAALADVGLGERYTHRPGQLSGGERQRVALARALVGRPRLLLADEPTAALDSASGEQVLGLLADLCRRDATTVVLVSHDPEAERLADRVLRLRDGRMLK